MLNSGVDLLAFETIPSIKEGIAICKLLEEKPETMAWLAFCCKVLFILEGVDYIKILNLNLRMNLNFVLVTHLMMLMRHFDIINNSLL